MNLPPTTSALEDIEKAIKDVLYAVMMGRVEDNESNADRFRDLAIDLTKYHAQHNSLVETITHVTFLWQPKWTRAWEISREPDGEGKLSLIQQFWRSMPFGQHIERSMPSPMSITSTLVVPAPRFVTEGTTQKQIIAVRKQGYGRQLLLEHLGPSGRPILELVTSGFFGGLRQLNLSLDSLPQFQIGNQQHLLHRSLNSVRITGVASLRRVTNCHSHDPMTFARLSFDDNDDGTGISYYYSRSILHKYFGKHIVDEKFNAYITDSQTPTPLLGQQRRYTTQGIQPREPRPSDAGTTPERSRTTNSVSPVNTEQDPSSERFRSFDGRLLSIDGTINHLVELLEQLGPSRL